MRHLHASFALAAALSAAVTGHAQFGAEQQLYSEGPRSIDLSDLDGDGDADLTIGARDGTIARVNVDGLGDWSIPEVLHMGMVVSALIDLNGDGANDLCGGLPFNGGLRWMPNLGVQGFGAAQTIATGCSVDVLADADLDQDGDRDLVLALEGGSVVWVRNTDGLGSFSSPLTITSANANAVQVADLDGNGHADVIWSEHLTGTVRCAFNPGNAQFGAPVTLTTAGEGRVGDVDADGHADIVLGDALNNELLWRRNTTGNGMLGQPQDIGATGADISRMLVQDLDADGDLDIVTASSALDEIAWYENRDGQADYGPRQVIGVGVTDPTILAAGDIDGDGDAEVFTGSAAQNRVVYYENLTYATGRILGRVFNDIDGDGLFNGNDHGLADVQVTLPGVGSVFTNHSGMYWIEVPTGSFSVQVATPLDWVPTTPTQRNASLLVNGNSAHTDFGMMADGTVHRLQPQVTNGAMRCNEQVRYWASVKNTGNAVCDVVLALDVDDLSGFVGADPQPVVQNGVAQWTFPSVQPGHHRTVEVILLLPGPDHMGDTLHDVLTATALVSGTAQATHVATVDPVLLCAYDPNDKQVVPAGEGEAHWTPMGSLLTYTIRFQNIGNAPAEDVEIVDVLDADLDPATVQVIASSHTHRTILDGSSGELRFRYDNIQLPDSASDPIGSQGFVRFAVRHRPSLPEATEVHNHAAIYFDLNPPIITNTVLNTLTYGTAVDDTPFTDAQITVFPNPAGELASVSIAAGVAGRVELSLVDATGRRVRQLTTTGGTITQLPRQGLPAGIYLLQARAAGLDRTVRLVFE